MRTVKASSSFLVVMDAVIHYELLSNVFRSDGTNTMFRLILGEQLDASKSKIFVDSDCVKKKETPLPHIKGMNVPTGTMGFCDFHLDWRLLPERDYIRSQKLTEGLTTRILELGIEPEYRGNSLSKTIVDFVKEISSKNGCRNIWYDNVMCTRLANSYRQAGFIQVRSSFVEYF